MQVIFNHSGKSWESDLHCLSRAPFIKGINQQLNIILHLHKPSVLWYGILGHLTLLQSVVKVQVGHQCQMMAESNIRMALYAI